VFWSKPDHSKTVCQFLYYTVLILHKRESTKPSKTCSTWEPKQLLVPNCFYLFGTHTHTSEAIPKTELSVPRATQYDAALKLNSLKAAEYNFWTPVYLVTLGSYRRYWPCWFVFGRFRGQI